MFWYPEPHLWRFKLATVALFPKDDMLPETCRFPETKNACGRLFSRKHGLGLPKHISSINAQ